jgi:hypothetical protein
VSVHDQSDSIKDSKQQELIEKEGRWVESQILPPAVPLFILKDEAQRIRAAGLKEESTTPNNSLAVEIRAIQAHGRWRSPKPTDEVEVDAG